MKFTRKGCSHGIDQAKTPRVPILSLKEEFHATRKTASCCS